HQYCAGDRYQLDPHHGDNHRPLIGAAAQLLRQAVTPDRVGDANDFINVGFSARAQLYSPGPSALHCPSSSRTPIPADESWLGVLHRKKTQPCIEPSSIDIATAIVMSNSITDQGD